MDTETETTPIATLGDAIAPVEDAIKTSPHLVSVGLAFHKAEDEKTDDGMKTVSFSARKSRSGIMLVRLSDGKADDLVLAAKKAEEDGDTDKAKELIEEAETHEKWVGSAVEFRGVWFEKGGKFHGPSLKTVALFRLECPHCGKVGVSGGDLVKAAHRAGINAQTGKEALALHGVCPWCKTNRVTSWSYFDFTSEDAKRAYGGVIDELKDACRTATEPFVIPPVCALVPAIEDEEIGEDEIPGEFPDLVNTLLERGLAFKDEDRNPYPLRLKDIHAFDQKEDDEVWGWQLISPEVYAGVTSFDAVDRGIKVDGVYSVDLQVFLQRAAGLRGRGKGPSQSLRDKVMSARRRHRKDVTL